MAIEVVSDIIRARKASWAKADLMVLIIMANYADPDGTNIFPSVEKLALACRLKERQVQSSIRALLNTGSAKDKGNPNKVLFLVQRANQSGFGGRRTNEYRIDLERVQKMQGCKLCGGAVCREKGCSKPDQPPQNLRGTGAKNNRGRVQKTASHIERPVNRPVRDLGAASPRAPERRGDRRQWEKLAAALEPERLAKLLAYGAIITTDGRALFVDFEKAYCERFVMPLRREVQAAAGMPAVFRIAGREVAV